MRDKRCLPLCQTSFIYSFCLSLRGPKLSSFSISEKLIMAFRGVLSSWDILAKNRLLVRLAISATSFARRVSFRLLSNLSLISQLKINKIFQTDHAKTILQIARNTCIGIRNKFKKDVTFITEAGKKSAFDAIIPLNIP